MSSSANHSTAQFEHLSREQLVARLCAAENRFLELSSNQDSDDALRNIHDLQVHKIELEMQNRHMRETQILLEDSRRRYEELYDHCPAALVSVDASGRVIQVNSSMAQLLGRTQSDLLGLVFARHVVPQDRNRFSKGLRRCYNGKGGEKYDDVVLLSGLYGLKTMHVYMQKNSWPGVDRSVVSVSMMDVSEYSRLNERVAFIASVGEEFCKTLELSSATDLILNMAVPHLADMAALTYCGEVLAEGCPRESSHVSCDENLWSPDEKQQIFNTFIKSNIIGKCIDGSRRIDWQSGSVSDCFTASESDVLLIHNVGRIQAWPLSSRGEILGVLWLVWSETKDEQALAAPSVLHDFMHRAALSLDNVNLYLLAQSQIKARSDFLAIVAHDLRNPLTVISMRVERMLQGKKLENTEFVKKSAEAIGRCAERMGSLVRDLLDATSMDSRRLSITPRQATVLEIVEDEITSHTALAASKGITLNKELDGSAQIFCDPCRASQVVSNLIGNAIKFTEAGGTISLRTKVLDEKVEISIQDTGCGMDESVQGKIFDPYWQAKPAGMSGVGLGLNICRKIVAASGGRIWFKSRVGEGSTFYFTLPRYESYQITSDSSDPAAAPIAPVAHILVVDDDESYRLVISEVLREQGYEVSTADNGRCAMDWLKSHVAPDLILLDLQMPVMDGFSFLRERAKDHVLNNIPVTVLSAAVHEVSIERTEKTRVLYKMTPMQDVLRAIAAVQEA